MTVFLFFIYFFFAEPELVGEVHLQGTPTPGAITLTNALVLLATPVTCIFTLRAKFPQGLHQTPGKPCTGRLPCDPAPGVFLRRTLCENLLLQVSDISRRTADPQF